MANYTQAFLTEFFEMYKDYPCLWKVKSEEYHNKNTRRRAFEVLVAKFKEVEPDANEDFVKKKINNFRTSYKREFKLVQKSMKSGSGSSDVYKPKLWYFKLTSFLDDQQLSRPSISNISDEEEELEADDVSNASLCSPSDITTTDATPFSEDSLFTAPTDLDNHETPVTVKKRKRAPDATERLLATINDKLMQSTSNEYQNRDRDRFAVFGENVAVKLRSVSVNQRILAEKLINDVLFEAEMNNLNRNWKLVVLNESSIVNQKQTSVTSTNIGNLQAAGNQDMTNTSAVKGNLQLHLPQGVYDNSNYSLGQLFGSFNPSTDYCE